MNQESSHIDWDKLLAILEKDVAQQQLLCGDLSEEEKGLLNDLQQLKGDKALISAIQLDSKQAWNKIAGNLTAQETIRPAFRWMRWVAAACLLFIAGTAVFFWLNHSTRLANTYASVAEALAGHTPADNVQLILADGKKIEASTVQQVKEKNGTAIKWDQDNINYNNSMPVQEGESGMNTLIVPRGHIQRITLADGTRIWMNADSKLRFPVQFGKSTRRIELEGEAYLEVTHAATWPFIVSTGGTETRVLGTSFDVKAYGSNIYTTLVTGRVSFKPPAGDEVILQPGQQAFYDHTKNTASSRQVSTEQWVAWKDNELIMDNMPLSELAEILERRYDVQIEITDERLRNIEYDAALDLTDNIVDLLENLEKAANIRFVVKDKTILIEPFPGK